MVKKFKNEGITGKFAQQGYEAKVIERRSVLSSVAAGAAGELSAGTVGVLLGAGVPAIIRLAIEVVATAAVGTVAGRTGRWRL